MATLERAIEIAHEAHAGRTDKTGAPYVTHPLRVMAAIPGGEAQIVAVLHDVVEKSSWTLDDLRREGFSDSVLAGVDSVTRRADESEDAFVRRAKADALGAVVKRADLLDNIARAREAGLETARHEAALEALDEVDVLGG